MGGDAFPSTQRLSEEEYARKCEEIRQVLSKAEVSFGFPVEVADKAEVCKERGKDKPYGDVDVIIAVDDKENRPSIVDLVQNVVGIEGDKQLKNDTIYSFLSIERFQIDLMFCEQEHLEFLLAFESNNDFGALLGHLLTPLKLKWSNLGLVLKLETSKVSGVGTCKAEVALTSDVSEVCRFLGLPGYSLDGKTRMSTREMFEVLTRTKVFFTGDYDENYQVRERRKRRPVSDAFFNFLESKQGDLVEEEKNDEVEILFRNFRNNSIEYEEYIEIIGEHFNKKEEVIERFNLLKETGSRKAKPNPKFNFQILCSWCPGIDQNTVGKIMASVKSKNSGTGKADFEDWINQTEMEEIKLQVEKCRDSLVKI
eukprot:GFUD01036619.1.p1 GENE.GFUD01036619.1~~GFUD01036619.1.p1  ORF type:complete len:368 (+),score=122.49 GFUD01036619.1:72-1175(+)